MAQEIRTSTDRRSQSRSDVSALILSRSDTLSRYADLASHRPYDENEKFAEELNMKEEIADLEVSISPVPFLDNITISANQKFDEIQTEENSDTEEE